MKNTIRIIIAVIIIYVSWEIFLKPSDKLNGKKPTTSIENLMTIKGIVESNYSILNYSIITVKTISSKKTYHILITNGADVPRIGSPVIIKIKKYTLIKINDKSITLYKQVDT